MRTRVSVDDLETAAAWLDINEGELGEMESCQRVREWLLAEVERREKGIVRRVAKAHNVDHKVVQKIMKGQ